ncbi:MAG: carbonic anhydrase [Acidobacteriota bacterium]
MNAAREALIRLREGNRRFVAGAPESAVRNRPDRRDQLVAGQAPFAVVLSCSDSRVPPETVFDQGLGDLFVVRVAGNVAAPEVIGSVEFATDVLGARLVVVLGHSGCGAVQATLATLDDPSAVGGSPHLGAIVSRIRPAVAGIALSDSSLPRAVRANVRAAADTLRTDSEVLAGLIADDGLRVVGAEYSLATGRVEFLDGRPEEA